jgi:HipA-like protein
VSPLPQIAATRYVSPLREGGSLPGLLEADDDGIYVVKWTGAGQGPLALVAEVIGIELARALGFRVPELALVAVDARLAEAEPDPEIQDPLRASAGLDLGIDFLPGAAPFEPPAPPALAADVVWLDGWLLNVDRTPRNPNLLSWHGEMWLIDFGAALYPQHGALDLPAQALRPFPALREHVLADTAESLDAAHERLAAPALAAIEEAVAMVPEDWLVTHPRQDYVEFLRARLRAAPWLGEAR